MTICDKVKKLFGKKDTPQVETNTFTESLTYLGISVADVKKDPVKAKNTIDENISKSKKKLPKLTKLELEDELKKVRDSRKTSDPNLVKMLFPQDVFRFLDDHLKSYISDIENELKKRQSDE